ncbi:MAG: hypothetical protein ACRCVI_02530 [Mycoplasmoidaceae bacterium]
MNLIYKNQIESSIQILKDITTQKIDPHWGYFVAGAICLVILILIVVLTVRHYINNKDNYYQEDFSKFAWFINFYRKNKFQFYIFLDIILLISTIVFFLAGSGVLAS